MSYPYFIFNDKHSKDYNIIVNKLPPVHLITNAIDYLPVLGRDGHLTINTGRRESITKEMTLTIYPLDRLEEIKQWLKGEGTITFSTEPNMFFRCNVHSVVEIEGNSNYRELTLSIKCQPWGYLLNGRATIEITQKNTTLYNNVEKSLPSIKVFGVGPVDLIINENIYKFTLDGYVEIDSELMESYKDILPVPMVGGFPFLVPGENNITWLGSVTKIEVIPRWRR